MVSPEPLVASAPEYPAPRGPIRWVDPSGESGVVQDSRTTESPRLSWMSPEGARGTTQDDSMAQIDAMPVVSHTPHSDVSESER